MSETDRDPHKLYVARLKYIGRCLGFETRGLQTDIGTLDCVWRYKESTKFLRSKKPDDVEIDYFMYGLPMVAFEVIFSERIKMLRGSILNMISAKPSLAIFVFLRRAREKEYPDEDVDLTERNIEKLCQEFAGFLRTRIWHEEDVDELYDKLVKEAS
jgi:hypothetical protein